MRQSQRGSLSDKEQTQVIRVALTSTSAHWECANREPGAFLIGIEAHPVSKANTRHTALRKLRVEYSKSE